MPTGIIRTTNGSLSIPPAWSMAYCLPGTYCAGGRIDGLIPDMLGVSFRFARPELGRILYGRAAEDQAERAGHD